MKDKEQIETLIEHLESELADYQQIDREERLLPKYKRNMGELRLALLHLRWVVE